MKLRTVAVIVALMSAAMWSSTGYAFSDLSLVGFYACSAKGTEVFTATGGSPTELAYVAVALQRFDGAGHATGKFTITLSENSSPPSGFSCTYATSTTYTVNSDGTGSSTEVATTVSGPCGNNTEVRSFVIDDAIGSSATFIPTSDTSSVGVVNSNVDLINCERQ